MVRWYADIFTGSDTANDVLDARMVTELEFDESTYTGTSSYQEEAEFYGTQQVTILGL